MRIEDAPPAGWYPDPEGSSRLRWWEGTDWSDRYRSRPIAAVVTDDAAGSVRPDAAPSDGGFRVPDTSAYAGQTVDSREVVEQVRLAARQEAERAAQMFGQQARAATRTIAPLITEYTSKVVRWFRIALVIAVVLVVAWIAFQMFAQVTIFEWIGDRIDNVTDDVGAVGPFR